jgi:hypothetical protein
MRAVTVIRAAISLFIVVLIAIAGAGWVWTGANQAPGQALGSRVVLALAVLAGLVGLRALWRRAEGPVGSRL